MNEAKNPMELVELLKGHKIYIQTHNFPDPDAIASAFGLQQLLLHYGIESVLCYDGKIDKLSSKKMIGTFQMEIRRTSDLHEMTEEDYVVIVDGQKYNSNFTDIIGDEVACIDHHPTVIKCHYHYSDLRIVGACASIIASYYQQCELEPPANVAAALAYGIKMDTADFTRGTTDFDVEMFSYLYHYADVESIREMYRNAMEFSDLEAYAAAIKNIQVFNRTGLAMIPFGCSDALIAIISDFILALDVVDVSIIYSERENGIKVSVRSEIPEIDAGVLVEEALSGIGSGGGHASMAGGFIPKENIREGIGEEEIRNIIESRFTNSEMLFHK